VRFRRSGLRECCPPPHHETDCQREAIQRVLIQDARDASVAQDARDESIPHITGDTEPPTNGEFGTSENVVRGVGLIEILSGLGERRTLAIVEPSDSATSVCNDAIRFASKSPAPAELKLPDLHV
jgi:hypothetical protein